MRTVVVVAACLLALAGCGGGADGNSSPPAQKPSKPAAVAYGSLTELKDAAVAGGYVCENWVADNVVTLAAESGTCSDDSVFSTYASESDLQAQLDLGKEMDEMSLNVGLDTSTQLIGPNWIITAPEVPQIYEDLAGVLIGAKTTK